MTSRRAAASGRDVAPAPASRAIIHDLGKRRRPPRAGGNCLTGAGIIATDAIRTNDADELPGQAIDADGAAAARLLVAGQSDEGVDAVDALPAGKGYRLCFAAAESAWQMLQADADERFDALIIDLAPDAAAGIALLRRVRASARLAGLPVLLLLPAAPLEQVAALVQQGLAAGAAHFLARPLDPETLLSLLSAAIEDAGSHESPAQLRGASFVLSTLDEAAAVAALIALAAPRPEAAQIGISELLINAVEHGSLGITHAEKGSLKRHGRWHEEVDRRAALPENRGKCVRASCRREGGRLVIRIRDEGCGFNWREYLDFDPQRALDLHGRGIAVARLASFDTLAYEADGRIAVATIVDPPPEGSAIDERK